MRSFQTGGALLAVFVAICAVSGMADEIQNPPIAKVVPHELVKHGDVRVDDYYWLNDREDPEVIAYLQGENAYTDHMLAHTKGLQEDLFAEIKGRIKQTDMSVPYKLDDYYYYTRYDEGKEYPIYCRKPGSLDGVEQVMLDVNGLAEGHEYYAVRSTNVSSGHDILAFAVDTVGRRIYTIKFKDLGAGEMLDDELAAVTPTMAWANDNKTLFYARQDEQTLRDYQIYRHTLGTPMADDVLVYEEKDEEFSCYVWRTKSKKFLMIGSYQTLSSEARYLDADNPTGEFTVFLPREADHEYDLDHYGDHFYVKTNWQATNSRLMRAPLDRTTKDAWEEVVPHRDDVLLTGIEIFKDHLVLSERSNALMNIRVMRWDGKADDYLNFGEPAYAAYIEKNPDFNTTLLRFGYESMTTPETIFDYDMNTRSKTLLKQEEVLGGFDSSDYATERLWADARDGTKVPISVVYRKGFKRDGSHPTLLYGYGSYGSSSSAWFDSARLSLLDRGFVWAIAHIRGGQEMGRHWYEDGKLLSKKNTFTDFVDCGKYLVEQQFADANRLFCWGGSAGGLLIGAVVNMEPAMWSGAIASVPFVDVVTTMLDETIPLTTGEYDEWGNPNEKAYYDYMLSYSPYDNVDALEYPNILVTTGLHDSQVQYFEPAKWVAKMRAKGTGNNWLLLKTNMEAGHSGTTGRFKRYEETALKYAFLIDLAGISSTP